MKSTLELGSHIDTLDRSELRDELAVHAQDRFRQFARGVKYLRFGPFGTHAVSSAFAIDGTQLGIGPREGFLWSIRRITVFGLVGGTTPDTALLYRNQAAGIPIWQFTGNSQFATFGKMEIALLGGETLSLASSGTIASTGLISISGDYMEVPAEEVFKLL